MIPITEGFHMFDPHEGATYRLCGRERSLNNDRCEPWVCFRTTDDIVKFVTEHTEPNSTYVEFRYVRMEAKE